MTDPCTGQTCNAEQLCVHNPQLNTLDRIVRKAFSAFGAIAHIRAASGEGLMIAMYVCLLQRGRFDVNPVKVILFTFNVIVLSVHKVCTLAIEPFSFEAAITELN